MQDLSRAVVLAPPVAAASLQDSLRMSRSFDRLAIGVLAALGITALLTFRDYGLSWDDHAHSAATRSADPAGGAMSSRCSPRLTANFESQHSLRL